MMVLFWASILFLVYTFIGYPCLLFLLSRLFGKEHLRSKTQPQLSILITAYNEGDRLRNKLRNTIALRYPREKLEIIVVSDGSSDDTVSIARSFESENLRVLDLKDRKGKNHALMSARDASKGEVLVFTDVSSKLHEEALECIAENFADPAVACVSSEDIILADDSGAGGEGAYVSLEMKLRRWESSLGSAVTASGSFFAARRGVCDSWHPEQTSDFFVPIHTVQQGFRAVVDPRSIGYYRATRSSKSEFQRKVRTVVNGIHVLLSHREAINPLRTGLFAWQLVSHKLCRWLIPFGILIALIANTFLWNAGLFYRATLIAQVIAYSMGILVVLVDRSTVFLPARLASFFLLGNLATLVAWVRYLRGDKLAVWQPTQR